jgi:hypothetical protein
MLTASHERDASDISTKENQGLLKAFDSRPFSSEENVLPFLVF